MTRDARELGKAVILLVIAAHVGMALAVADDMVLCVAEDGRVSIEEAEAGRCVNTHEVSCSTDAEPARDDCRSSSDACCGICLDIPISFSSPRALQVPMPNDAGEGPAVALDLSGSFDTLAQDSPGARIETPEVDPVARSALEDLRTVVLII